MTHVQTAARAIESSQRRIEATVTPLPRELLIWRPSADVWSILDNLAHVEEFVPFWIAEIHAMLATPPQLWGRDQSHAGRLAAVRDTSARRLDDLLASIKTGISDASVYLRSLEDNQLDVEAVSRNPRWSIKPVSFVVDTLLVRHLSDHCGQIERNIQQYKQTH